MKARKKGSLRPYSQIGGFAGDLVRLRGKRIQDVGEVLFFDGGLSQTFTVVKFADGMRSKLLTCDLVLVEKGPGWKK